MPVWAGSDMETRDRCWAEKMQKVNKMLRHMWKSKLAVAALLMAVGGNAAYAEKAQPQKGPAKGTEPKVEKKGESRAEEAERLRLQREAFFKRAEAELKPTPKQKQQIQAVIASITRQIRAARSDKKLPASQREERVGELHHALYQQIMPILTVEQRAKLRKLVADTHPTLAG
jgi:hypothetical protein